MEAPDDPSTLATFKAILTLNGYDVVVARNAEQAIDVVQSKLASPDLIVSGLRMSDRSGLELLAEVRLNAPGIPFVLYSAFATPAITSAAWKLGALDVLDGPILPDTLVDVVRRALERSDEDPGAPVFDSSVGPATERWCQAVRAVVLHSRDVPTVQAWARFVHSVTTLKKMCEVCGTTAALSLDFARAFRVSRNYAGRRCNWYNQLDIKEPETMKTFLARAGFEERAPVPTVDVFCTRQRLILSPSMIEALVKMLRTPQ